MSKLARSALIWTLAFLALELPAHFFTNWPWYTLSSTVWAGIRWWHVLAGFTTLFLVTLWGHFERGWPATALIVEALVATVAILVHVLSA